MCVFLLILATFIVLCSFNFITGLYLVTVIEATHPETCNETFTQLRNLVKTFVCPDYLICCPELSSIIQETEIIAREFFYNIHIKKNALMKKEVVAAAID